MRIALFLLGLTLVLTSPASARDYILYSRIGDVDADRVAERVVIYSSNPNPRKGKSVALAVQEKRGGQWRTVFREKSVDHEFHPENNNLAAQTGGMKTGLYIRKTDARYPDIFIVFTPNSGDFFLYRYNGSTYKLLDVGN
ncbi:MAG: hypothetical protein FJX76_09000 [Armatimonadetes bacterium]|nr:hypothetical protein [Armatimonadota bacterium]